MMTHSSISGTIVPGLVLVGVLAIWEGAVRFTEYPAYLLPTPSAIAWRMFTDRSVLLKHSVVTSLEVFLGFAFGVAAGVILAVFTTHSRIAERVVMPVALLLQTTPKLALAPLFLIWFGYGMFPKIIMTVLMCLFPILINVAAGLRSVDTRFLEYLSILQATRWQILVKVRFPTAFPHLFVGLKVSMTLAVIGAVVGEWVGSSAGLGHLILAANSQLDTVLVFSSVATITILGTVSYFAVCVVEKWSIGTQKSIDPFRQI